MKKIGSVMVVLLLVLQVSSTNIHAEKGRFEKQNDIFKPLWERLFGTLSLFNLFDELPPPIFLRVMLFFIHFTHHKNYAGGSRPQSGENETTEDGNESGYNPPNGGGGSGSGSGGSGSGSGGGSGGGYSGQGFSSNNSAPLIFGEYPSDEAYDVPAVLTKINVTIIDPDGDSFNWTIETSPNIGNNSGSDDYNGSKICNISELMDGISYKWFINVTDGTAWTNATYNFTTCSNPFGAALGTTLYNIPYSSFLDDLGVHRFKFAFSWSDIEPEDDVYNWTLVDSFLQEIRPEDAALFNIFTNGWATNNDGIKGSTFLNNESKEKYREFITDLVNHTQGKITYWERDTEPATLFHYPSDKYVEYVEAQQIFYESVKSVQPNAIVLGIGATTDFTEAGYHSNPQFFLYVLEHGKDYFDSLELREYRDKYDIPWKVQWFKDAMQYYGYEKPIVCAEHGPDPRGQLNGSWESMWAQLLENCTNVSYENRTQFKLNWLEENFQNLSSKVQIFLLPASSEQNAKRDRMHAHDLVQRECIMLNAGIKESMYWNLASGGTDPVFGKMSLLTVNHTNMTITPAYYYYRLMVDKLGNMSSIEKISLSNESIYYYKITKSDANTLYVVWHREENVDWYDAEDAPPVTVELPISFNNVTITDVFGNESIESTNEGILTIDVDDTPLYIEEMD